jgi:hypothetical protein
MSQEATRARELQWVVRGGVARTVLKAQMPAVVPPAELLPVELVPSDPFTGSTK